MSRYIDADALKKAYMDAFTSDIVNIEKHSYWSSFVVRQIVNDMPTADVRENVKGRWNPINTTSEARQCSACGFVFGDVKMIRMSPTTSVIQHAYDFAFCPMCGADMRGDNHD